MSESPPRCATVARNTASLAAALLALAALGAAPAKADGNPCRGPEGERPEGVECSAPARRAPARQHAQPRRSGTPHTNAASGEAPPSGYEFHTLNVGGGPLRVPVPTGWCVVEGKALEKAVERRILPQPFAPVRSPAWLMPCDRYDDWAAAVLDFERPEAGDIAMVGRLADGGRRGSIWRGSVPDAGAPGDEGLGQMTEDAHVAMLRGDTRTFSWANGAVTVRGVIQPSRYPDGFVGEDMTAGAAVPITRGGRAVVVYHRPSPSGDGVPALVLHGLTCHAGVLAYANGAGMPRGACDTRPRS